MKFSTYFALFSEFGTAEIPLDQVASKYFGLDVETAKRRAAMNRLPIVVYRVSGQKSPWLVNAKDLAELLDKQREAAAEEFERSKAA